MKALVVGGEKRVVERVCKDLQAAAYEVKTATDGAKGLEMALECRYALVVMDITLRGIDAWRLCDVLRTQRHRPSIVMLTSPHACADVYLPSLYDTQEFLARVRGLLCKRERRTIPAVQIGDLKIDTARHCVTRAGVEIDLSLREYSLLEALAINEGRVLTREAIQERVWQNEEAVSKTVDVYIGRLRRRIDAGHKIKLIQTIRGLGYCLRLQERNDACGAQA